MDLGKLSRGERIIVVAGVLLVIDLLFLPWHSITVPFIGSVDRNGISSPNAFLGFLAAMRTEPEVGDIFRATMIARLQNHLRSLLASELGEDFPDLDLRAAAGGHPGSHRRTPRRLCGYADFSDNLRKPATPHRRLGLSPA